MSQAHERASALLRPMRRIQTHTSDTDRASIQRREQTVSALLDLVSEGQRARRQKRRVATALVSAAALAAGLSVWFGRNLAQLKHGPMPALDGPLRVAAISGQISVRQKSGRIRPGEVGQSLDEQDEIIAERSGTASLILSNGAQVRMAENSQVVIGTQGPMTQRQSLNLKRGTVNLLVPKLAPGQQFSIATAQAWIAVVGTHFWVSVLPQTEGHGERTCVGVSEGRVEITAPRTQHFLTAGGHWSSDGLPCFERIVAPNAPGVVPSIRSEPDRPQLEAPARPSISAAPDPKPPGVVAGQGSGARSRLETPVRRRQAGPSEDDTTAPQPSNADDHPPPTAAFEDSSLEEQNQLFAAAVAARHASQPAQAVELLTSLLRRYPKSPLATAASRELAKARSELLAKPGTSP